MIAGPGWTEKGAMLRTWLPLLVLVACAADPASPREAWVTLFDGTNLDRFETATAPDAFAIEDGGILSVRGRTGARLLTRESFSDFELRLEFRIDAAARASILLRAAPGPDGAALVIPVSDLLGPPGPSLQNCGAIEGLAPADGTQSRPAGEWNELVVRCEGSRVTTSINGLSAARADLAASGTPWPASGRIGLRDDGHFVWFRMLRIRPL